jgi:hypothetical protein
LNPRIIPLNLPAGLEKETPGNPVTTRPESAVGNCYPGLEVDARNLDRRFFPGLIFDFVSVPDASPQVANRGAKLVTVDLADPELPSNRAELLKQLATLANVLATTSVFLEALSVENGPRIELIRPDGLPYDWDVTWRIVRSVDAKPVTIELVARNGTKRSPIMTLTAQRRRFQNKEGELSAAYQPGELSQSLCSPWQHDFRDCACTYWASNHPDIVLAAHPATIDETHDPGQAAERAEDPIIWMRWDQSKEAPPRGTRDACRPFEMDHYEINERWRDLAIVLGDRERHTPWSIGPSDQAAPLDPRGLATELSRLAGIEHALALEYLYARYTVRFDDALLAPEDMERANFIAHELLTIAIGEMMHLRWVNQLIWELDGTGDISHAPALSVATHVPAQDRIQTNRRRAAPKAVRMRRPQMRSVDKAIDDFIAAEAPSGGIEGQYAKLLALLRHGLQPAIARDGPRSNGKAEKSDSRSECRGRRDFSPDLIGLVERIIADGVSHYSRFREIKALLNRPGGKPILRTLRKITENSMPVKITFSDGKTGLATYAGFVSLYRELIGNLRDAYSSGRAEDRIFIIQARHAMAEIDHRATELAKKGKSVPLLDISREALRRADKRGRSTQ